MKNILDYIRKYPHRSKRLLGIDYPQFLQLLEQAQLKHAEQQAEIERQKIRVNAKGGGRKPRGISFLNDTGNGSIMSASKF